MKTTADLDDISLATRLIAGDRQAFDHFYTRYFRTIYNNVICILKNDRETEDVVQDSFLALWEKRHTLKQPENTAGWLFVTSSNKSLNQLRRRLRARLGPLPPEEMADIVFMEPETDLADLQLRILKKAIAALTPRQRRVFELCKLEGRSYEETAEALNISKNTVKTHMALALQGIKEGVLREREGVLGASLLVALLGFSNG